MTAGRWDITIEQGAAFGESYLIQGSDGNALDLTGCTAAMQVRVNIGDPSALLTLTTENGGLAIDGPNGAITPDFDTSPLNPGTYVYDLKLRDSGGAPVRLMQGSVTVLQETTTI
ncbi:hypothetical protein [Zavarzinella formosa]|uniref:hypothetical protein n=1 Tax=Zavarzinella formosa TaxID=360055 RepID=UPI0002F8CB2E|nr:hypothetical protein [Zavarzinella formosa]